MRTKVISSRLFGRVRLHQFPERHLGHIEEPMWSLQSRGVILFSSFQFYLEVDVTIERTATNEPQHIIFNKYISILKELIIILI